MSLQVNGDTLFMTGNFKEFKVESRANDTWDEHNVMASTAVRISFIPIVYARMSILNSCFHDTKLNFLLQDYLASIDSASQAGFDLK